MKAMKNQLRRGALHHRHAAAGAQFADSGVPLSFGGSDEGAAAQRLGLADLSLLPRGGYKGTGAPAWLRQQGVTLPPQPNQAVAQDDGTLVAALSPQEHLLLSPLTAAADGLCQQLAGCWSLDNAAQCYQLPRADSHCWFAVCGDYAVDVLAKLCGVDLRPRHFAAHAVAQTSLARLNAIVIRLPAEPALFYLLADNPSADYLWDCLLDAMAEFDGAVVGLNTLAGAAARQNDGG